jgi:signal transduction histidine kinase
VLLKEALVNLISNGLKFVRKGVQPRIRIWTEAAGGRVRLWVGDNGIGIAPEHREIIFGVFERLHPVDVYPGTGIGLAIVRRAVERMGGTVGVESGPQEGSRFWLDLASGQEPTNNN